MQIMKEEGVTLKKRVSGKKKKRTTVTATSDGDSDRKEDEIAADRTLMEESEALAASSIREESIVDQWLKDNVDFVDFEAEKMELAAMMMDTEHETPFKRAKTVRKGAMLGSRRR